MNSAEPKALDPFEQIKADSRLLRGTLMDSLEDTTTGAIPEADAKLLKFHGSYMQDDRDQRQTRRQARLEPLFSFMTRVRVPGGELSAGQWLALDALAERYANQTLRLTTRQAIQFHGTYKESLRALMQGLDHVGLDALAACGDVNRNVMCHPNAKRNSIHEQVHPIAVRLSQALSPHTHAYREIWINGKKVEQHHEVEPLYGRTYLPRKFKTVIAIPPVNDVDVFAHDLGFIAIHKAGQLQGFNVTVGGGMGTSHGDPDTFPRLADVVGFCQPQQVVAVAEAVISIQRDHGNREKRSQARLKYTIERMGLEAFKNELFWRLRRPLAETKAFAFSHTGDPVGWAQDDSGHWHLNLYIENGRIKGPLREGLRILAERYVPRLCISANQNLILADIREEDRPAVYALVEQYKLNAYQRLSPTRLLAMACVGLPTCGLAMAESERYLPELLKRVDRLLEQHGLSDQAISLRMTGCPNGCARPYLAEIGLVGKAPGRYNLHLGAAANGTRLNRLAAESLSEAEVLQRLDDLFADYASHRQPTESFGDFLIRDGHVAAVNHGSEAIRVSA
jgi:sulfite reductase (NADPH) hemoprotein beta-component